jgi:hypothetical protein
VFVHFLLKEFLPQSLSKGKKSDCAVFIKTFSFQKTPGGCASLHEEKVFFFFFIKKTR